MIREPVTAAAPASAGEESPDSTGQEAPCSEGYREANSREGQRDREHTAGSDPGKGEKAVQETTGRRSDPRRLASPFRSKTK